MNLMKKKYNNNNNKNHKIKDKLFGLSEKINTSFFSCYELSNVCSIPKARVVSVK